MHGSETFAVSADGFREDSGLRLSGELGRRESLTFSRR